MDSTTRSIPCTFPDMARILRLLSAFLALTVATAIVEPFIVAWLTSVRWYEEPAESVGLAVNWLASIVGEGAFPWIAAGVLGLALGSWLDATLRRFDRSRLRRRQEVVTKLGAQLIETARSIEIALQFDRQDLLPLTSDVESGLTSLAKIGIRPLEKREGDSLHESLLRARLYLHRVGTLLRDGHIREAREAGARMASLGVGVTDNSSGTDT